MRRFAIVVSLWLAPAIAAAQSSEAAPRDDASLPIEIAGCATEAFDADELRRRVALELGDGSREGVAIEVELACGSGEARVSVIEAAERTIRVVDLGDAEGTARVWALAIVIADFARRPSDPAPPSTSVELRSARLGAPHIADDELASRAPDAPRAQPSTWLAVGLDGRLTFDGTSAVGSAMVALRYDWFRVAITAGGTHRGSALGQIAALSLMADVSARITAHADPSLALAAELFAHGGVVYGIGVAASPAIAAHDAVSAVLGAGVGVRASILPGAPIGVEIGLRVGYDVLGANLVAGSETLVRLYGLFGSLDVAITLPID